MRVVKNKVRKSQSVLHQAIEALEPRQLLSASLPNLAGLKATPDANPLRYNNFAGYSPAQIRTAYGFDSITQDGTGQTIAIVDAFADPNIISDLQTFDSHYGLSNPTVNLYDEYGGSNPTGIAEDDDWAIETSLDVEWSHAMAPGATIDLIQADSDSLQDLYNGVATAASLPNVSVVSMSFGSSEFPEEFDVDRYLMTPVGHQGVTFIASSGDDGITGVSYPASSPYVMSVGGTSLTLNNGAYGSESTWIGSVGGESMFEPTPSYQSNIMNVAHRTVPDVSYDADVNTGFSVYDSIGYVDDSGVTHSGFIDIGGTSAGSPQWAAIVALTNQERATDGLGTLNGVSETLPALYSFYGARRHTAAYSIYHSLFNDITTGQNLSMFELGEGGSLDVPGYSSQVLFDGGLNGVSAAPGYDQVTGLGTPQVGTLVDALAAYDPTVTPAHHHRSTATAATATAAPMSRAARRRLQAALAAKVSADVVRPGQQETVAPVSSNPSTSAPQVNPSTPTIPTISQLPISSPPGTALQLSSTGPGAAIFASANSSSTAGMIAVTPFKSTYGGTAVSMQTPSDMSLAAMPGITATSLENLLEASAATTYSTSLQLVRLDAVTALADTVSLFVQQATSSVLPGIGQLTTTGSKPLAVVLGVLTVDAMLLGRALRRRRWALDRSWAQSPFALMDVPADD